MRTFSIPTTIATLVVLGAVAPPAHAAPTPVAITTLQDASGSWHDDCEGTRTTSSIPGEVEVTRQAPFDAPLDVHYQVGGDTTPGVEYEALPGVVTIPAGAASAVIEVVPTPDTTGPGIFVEITVVNDDEVAAPANPTATVGITVVSGASFCHELTLVSLVAPAYETPIQCDVHGNATYLDPVLFPGEVTIRRTDFHGDLVVGWAIVDPQGVRPDLTGTVTIPDDLLTYTFEIPAMAPDSEGEFRLVRDPGLYSLLGETSAPFDVVHVPVTGYFCEGPRQYDDRSLTMQVGESVPVERVFVDSGSVYTGRETFRLASGTLPPGLRIDEDKGLVGTATAPGRFTFAVENCQVADNGERACASSGYEIEVLGAAALPATGAGAPPLTLLALVLLAAGGLCLGHADRLRTRQRMLARIMT